MNIDKEIEKYVKDISITPTRLDELRGKHSHFRNDVLADYEDYKIVEDYLSGSYAKNVVVKDLCEDSKPDVDIVICFDIDVDSVSPAELVNSFVEFITDKKGAVSKNIRKQTHSVRVEYSEVDVDLVLCIRKNEKELYIVNTQSNYWEETTDPLEHINKSEELSSKTRGYYLKVHKILKYLNKNKLNYKLKSFTIESLVNECIPIKTDNFILEMLFETLSNIIEMESMPDCISISESTIYNSFVGELNEIVSNIALAFNGEYSKLNNIFDLNLEDEIIENDFKANKSYNQYYEKN